MPVGHAIASRVRLRMQQPSPVVRSGENVLASTVPSFRPMEDPWIEQFVSNTVLPDIDRHGLEGLNRSCMESLASLGMPTLRQEEYRFTDMSPLTRSGLYVAQNPPGVSEAVCEMSLDQDAITIVVVNGIVHSVDIGGSLPEGAYVGNVDGAPKDILQFSLGNQSKSRGGVFATMNGASARDCAVVYVPEECALERPIHVINMTSSSPSDQTQAPELAYSAPRVLIFLEAGASARVVEEFVSLDGSGGAGGTATFSVTEIELDDRASLSHTFVELENTSAITVKSTFVSQGTESTYELTEVRLGGELSRHDVGIVQLGERTRTEMKHFILAGDGQTHDLHTQLVLDHPDGVADQVHKCIVASDTAKGVFDGNVKVNRMAQRTDAGQLSRNLLLAPRATVNVKPNLQIVADDVKCTHGCAVSDLESEQLFYLQARGIDPASARKMLVYSFGGEVIQHLKDKKLISRVEEKTTSTLDGIFAE